MKPATTISTRRYSGRSRWISRCARMRSTSVGFGASLGAHPSPMKSRTSTSAPGRSAVSARAAPARFCQATRNAFGVDGLAAAGVDLEVQVRRGRLGVAGVADVAEDRPRLDVAVVDRRRGEGREVRVEELVAAVGVDPQAVAGDRQRADVLDRAVGGRHDGRAEVGEQVVALVRAGVGAEGAERAADRRLAADREDEAACDISRFFQPASCRAASGVAVGSGVAVVVGSAVGRRGRGRRRLRRRGAGAAETSATTTLVPAGNPLRSSVSVTVSPAPPLLTTTLPASNVYVFVRSTEPISRSPSTRSRTLPRYLTPLAVARRGARDDRGRDLAAEAARGRRPRPAPSRSRRSRTWSRCRSRRRARPRPAACAGMLPLRRPAAGHALGRDLAEVAGDHGHRAPSRGAWAVAADTSVPAATAISDRRLATIKRTQRVCQALTSRRPACSGGSRAARTRPAAPRTTGTPPRRRCWRACRATGGARRRPPS